jgi:hypothetical protein
MKKICLVAAILMLATTAEAVVNITCTPGTGADSNQVTVSYAVSGEPNKISGLGLDITVDGGAKIVSVSNLNAKYNIYPGSIVITGGQITDYGTPVADPNFPGTLGGLGTGGITIEMGALYYPTGDNSPNAPPLTGDLLKFRVDKSCTVTVAENAIRGGVVLTNPNVNPTSVNLTGCIVVYGPIDCLIGGNADGTVPGSEFAAWATWGKPNCWCYARQCRGDANGKKTGPSWVQLLDLQVLAGAYNKNDVALAAIPNGICADFNHKKTGPARVQLLDLQELAKYFNKADALVPECDAAPIITGPYRFWKVP